MKHLKKAKWHRPKHCVYNNENKVTSMNILSNKKVTSMNILSNKKKDFKNSLRWREKIS